MYISILEKGWPFNTTTKTEKNIVWTSDTFYIVPQSHLPGYQGPHRIFSYELQSSFYTSKQIFEDVNKAQPETSVVIQAWKPSPQKTEGGGGGEILGYVAKPGPSQIKNYCTKVCEQLRVRSY